MFALILSITVGGLAVERSAPPAFDHPAFCNQMQTAAAQDEVRAGTVIDRTTRHGGIAVNCEDRTVDVRTLLSRPAKKSWVQAQQRNWADDICSDLAVADAIANGWRVTASIVVQGKVVAVFAPRCGGGR